MSQLKRGYFEVLFDKMNKALEEEFYFETIWIAYAFIESRIDSALDKTGGIPGGLFGSKLNALKNLKLSPKLEIWRLLPLCIRM